MSLIHDAIREMEKSSAPLAAVPHLPHAPHVKRYPTQPDSEFWPGLIGFAVVLAIGVAAWWLWPHMTDFLRKQKADERAVVTAPPAAPPALAGIATPVAMPVANPVAASGDAPVAAPIGALASSTPAVQAAFPQTAATTAQRIEPQTAASTKAPQAKQVPPVRRASTASAAVPSAAPVLNEVVPLEQRYALFLQALSANDMAQAGQQLKALQAQVAPDNLARLRAEAWFAARSGDAPGARSGYLNILERLPGDEWASINLASLAAAADKREEARQILAEALRSNPESEALLAAIARFKNTGVN